MMLTNTYRTIASAPGTTSTRSSVPAGCLRQTCKTVRLGASHTFCGPAVRSTQLGQSLVAAAGKGFGAAPVVSSNEASKATKACSCGSSKLYTECCQVYHSKAAVPTDAEAAMRARFSAYALKDAKYIVRTTHPRNPTTKGSTGTTGALVLKSTSTFQQDVRATMNNFDVSSLNILAVEAGATEDETFISYEFTMKQVRGENGFKLVEPRVFTLKERARMARRQGDPEWLLLGCDSNWDKKAMRVADAAAVPGEAAAPAAPAAPAATA